MNSDKDVFTFTDHEHWRAWLEANHHETSEAWILIQRKNSSAPGISLDEAVEEALCYGWIDSTLHTRDDQSYLLRFSPRKPGSVWSMNNIRRVEKLRQAERMTSAGLAAVQAAKESGEWQAAIDRENPEYLPPDLEQAFKQDPEVGNAFRKLPESKRKMYVYWLQSAKQKKTKKKRVVEIIRFVRDEHNQ